MKKILNILLGILMAITVVLMVYAIATGGSDASISVNLMWGYFLFVFAVAAAIFCAVLIIIIVGVSYFYSAGHTVNIVDLQNNGFFGHGETVITETSILVTYVACVAAFVTAVATEIWGAFK